MSQLYEWCDKISSNESNGLTGSYMYLFINLFVKKSGIMEILYDSKQDISLWT